MYLPGLSLACYSSLRRFTHSLSVLKSALAALRGSLGDRWTCRPSCIMHHASLTTQRTCTYHIRYLISATDQGSSYRLHSCLSPAQVQQQKKNSVMNILKKGYETGCFLQYGTQIPAPPVTSRVCPVTYEAKDEARLTCTIRSL